MANDTTPPGRSTLVNLTVARLKVAQAAEGKQRQREKDDLAFQVPELQWPKDVQANRGAAVVKGIKIPARPMLSVATLDEPIQLVLNQEKAAHLGVNIHPLTEDAADDTAEMLQGLYRAIERDSRANLARSWAYGRAVRAGRGVYRVLKDYDYDTGTPGDQKIVIRRVLYQDAVWLDPFAQEPDFSDMEWAIIVTDMPWTKYQRLYGTKPDGTRSRLAGMTDGELQALGRDQPGWVGGDDEESRTVRVAEHYYLEYDAPTPVAGVTTTGEAATAHTEPTRHVRWCLVNGVEELDAEEWDGRYIPIIVTVGNELQPFDQERRWTGMTMNAKDGVRLTNFAASGAVEMAALEPKAPWQGEEGVFEGHEEEYQQSNIRNIPFLQYKRIGTSGQPADAPQRVHVDLSRLGPSMELLRMGRDFVQAATMTFDPALGKQPTAHRSGVAIGKLQDQTVFGTSHYLSNLAEISMTYEARVVLDLIPFVYDRPGRVARILDENDQPSKVMLNQPFVVDEHTKRPMAVPANGMNPQQLADDDRTSIRHYDLAKGRYGVSVTIGKSSVSRLQQGSDEMGEIIQAAPQLLPVIGPEYFRFRDFPGARTIAKLLKKMRDNQFPFLRDEAETPNAAEQLAAAETAMKEMHGQLADAIKAVETDRAKYAAQVEIKRMEFESQTHLQAMKNAAAVVIAKINAATKGYLAERTAENEARALQETHDFEAEQAGQDRAHALGLATQASGEAADAARRAQAHDAALAAGDVALRVTEPTPAAPSAPPPDPAAPDEIY